MRFTSAAKHHVASKPQVFNMGVQRVTPLSQLMEVPGH
jgi:hypothetical protein